LIRESYQSVEDIELDDDGVANRTTLSLMLTLWVAALTTIRPLAQADASSKERRFSVRDWLSEQFGLPRTIILQHNAEYPVLSTAISGLLVDVVCGKLLSPSMPKRDRPWLHLILDELPVLGRLEQFPKLLNVGREKGAAAIVATQDWEQVLKLYQRHDAATLEARFKIKVVCKLGISETRDRVVRKYAGRRTSKRGLSPAGTDLRKFVARMKSTSLSQITWTMNLAYAPLMVPLSFVSWFSVSAILPSSRFRSRNGENDAKPTGTPPGRRLARKHEGGTESWAILASLVNTAKLHDLDPQAYLADVLKRTISGQSFWPATGRLPAKALRVSPYGRRRQRASSATAGAMPLQELEQWLQERAERRPTAPALGCWTDTSLQSSPAPYRSPRSTGSVRRRCRCIQPWRHDGVRGDLHRRTSPHQHRQVVLNRSASLPADPPAQAERRCRRVSVVRGIPCRRGGCHCRPGRRWSTLNPWPRINSATFSTLTGTRR
jgi:hypothetical protein